jgi:hypothetical protein
MKILARLDGVDEEESSIMCPVSGSAQLSSSAASRVEDKNEDDISVVSL